MLIRNSFAELIKYILQDVYKNGNILKVRGYETKEIVNYNFILNNPLSNLFYNEVHESKLKYIAGELLWYFSGRNDVDYISKYSTFWKTICNSDGTCNSAYGNLIFKNTPQYVWALNALQSDMYSRQAIMHFNLPEHQYIGNKDFVCTMYANFHIRPDSNNVHRLNLSVFMRSNDAVFGLMNDIVFFTLLQYQMFKHLKDTRYPDLEIGTYSHTSNSMHIYDRHYDKIEKMLEFEFKPIEIPKIKQDLINIDGSPNEKLIKCMENLDNPECLTLFEETDELYYFLLKNANLKK